MPQVHTGIEPVPAVPVHQASYILYLFLSPSYLSTPPFTMLMYLALSVLNFLNKFLYCFKMTLVNSISSYLIKIDYIANPNMANI